MQLNYNLEMQPAVAGSLYDLSTKTVDSFSAEEAMNAGVPVIPGTAEGLVKPVATGEAAKAIGIAAFTHKQDIEGAEKYYEKGYILPVITCGRVWVAVEGDITAFSAAKYDPTTGKWKADGSEEIPNAKFITSANSGYAVVQIG